VTQDPLRSKAGSKSRSAANLDLVFARLANDPVQGRLTEELNAEVLFNDQYAVVVGEKSKWARRRRIELADLVGEPWIMTPLDALGESFVAKALEYAD
jgi:DNA-binding transcriptional LysR family regulator